MNPLRHAPSASSRSCRCHSRRCACRGGRVARHPGRRRATVTRRRRRRRDGGRAPQSGVHGPHSRLPRDRAERGRRWHRDAEVPDRRRPLQADGRVATPSGAGDPHDQRLRRQQERPGVAREARGRTRLRRALLLRPRVRRLRLQDLPRRPVVRRPGRQPAGQLPRRQDRHRDHHGGKTVPAVRWIAHDREDHLGHHVAHDPRVGMVGGSYGGQIQFAVADKDPRLDAIVPIITWSDLSYSLAPNNTGFTHGVTYASNAPGTEKLDWVDAVLRRRDRRRRPGRPGRPEPRRRLRQLPDARVQGQGRARRQRWSHQGPVQLRPARLGRELLSPHPDPDAARPGPGRHAVQPAGVGGDVPVPSRQQGTPVKLIWQSWGHSDLDARPGRVRDRTRRRPSHLRGQARLRLVRPLPQGQARSAPARASPTTATTCRSRATGPDTVQYGHLVALPSRPHEDLLRLRLLVAGGTRSTQVVAGSASYTNLGGGVPDELLGDLGRSRDEIPDQATPPSDTPGSFAGLDEPSR